MTFFKRHNLIKHLKGKGIEIGALNNPLKINSKKCKVTYVDRLNKEDLMKHNPTISNERIKIPDVVGDAMDLHMFADESMDFLIANHLLEHLPNPIKAMENFYRILKTDGILYLTIPDKRYTFDCERPTTTLSHLIDDFKKGTKEEDDIKHYEEWFALVEMKRPAQSRWNLEDLVANRCTIHFHAWLPESILELLNYMKNNLGVYFQLQDYYYQKGNADIVFILKRVNNYAPFPDFPAQLKEKYSLARIILCKVFDFIYSIFCYPVRFIRKIMI